VLEAQGCLLPKLLRVAARGPTPRLNPPGVSEVADAIPLSLAVLAREHPPGCAPRICSSTNCATSFRITTGVCRLFHARCRGFARARVSV